MTDTEDEQIARDELHTRLVSELAGEYGPLRDDNGGKDGVDWRRAVRDVVLPIVYDHYGSDSPRRLIELYQETHDDAKSEGELTDDQQRRVNALAKARGLVEQRGSPKGPFTAASVQVDVIDLHNIAEYIITGNDPWQLPRKRWWRR